MFTIVQSDIREPVYISEYLWALSDPETLSGECGYYLTVFCSALEFLHNMNPETGQIISKEEEEAENSDEPLPDKNSENK